MHAGRVFTALAKGSARCLSQDHDPIRDLLLIHGHGDSDPIVLREQAIAILLAFEPRLDDLCRIALARGETQAKLSGFVILRLRMSNGVWPSRSLLLRTFRAARSRAK